MSNHVKRANASEAVGTPAPRRRSRAAQAAVIALIVVTATGVTVLSISLRAAPPAPTAAAPPLAAVPTTTALTGQPKPWEYDAASNRHWNPEPGHQHWHNGPPPVPGQSTGATTLSGPFSGQVPGNLGPVSLSPGGPQPVTPAPAGPQPGDPEAWQYDAANNQHWHPGHRHWHPGQPPPPEQRTP
jgi:hypothetical protein